MRSMNRLLPPLASAAVLACLCATPALHAGPLNADGKQVIELAAPADNAQGREFSAGVQAQAKGDLATAKSRFEAALTIDAQYAPALIGLAGLAQSQGQTAQVEQYLQRAERASPKSPEVHIAWGRHFMATRQLDRAEKSLMTARDLAPKAVPPLLELGEIYIRTPGKTADALRMYKAAVALDGNNVFAQYGLGVALIAAGQRTEGIKALERAAELAPKDPAPLRAIGRVHFETGALDQALAAFDTGLARRANFLPLMLDRADALARLSRWADATAQLTAAEKLAPKSAEIQIKLADVHQGAQRWKEAEAGYLKAIALDAGNPLAYNNLAWMTVERKGDLKKAIEWAGKAVALSPKSSPLHDTLGVAQRAAGDLPGAQKSLQRAIELEPKVGVYHYHLGLVLRDLKQPAAARASLQRALEIDGKLPQAEETRRLIKEMTVS
jgi:tetratricopeptide (TPR) repeat protein